MRKFPHSVCLLAILGTSLSAQASIEISTYKLGHIATIKPNALIQVWSIVNSNFAPNNQHLRLRRAEIKGTGTLVQSTKYFLMIDPARLIPPPGGKPIAANMMFQDFGLSREILPGLEISAGQLKAPTSAEALDSSGNLILPERSLAARVIGERRELGILANYKIEKWNVSSMISSARAIYNTGSYTLKDLHTRIEYAPLKDLSCGGFISLGNGFSYSNRGRWGINARYKIADIVLRTEYDQAKDTSIQSHGFTAEVGYWVTPRIQPVFRYESFSPNQAATKSTTLAQAESLGLNYVLTEYNLKLQFSASALQNLVDPNGTPALAKSVHNGEFMMSLQSTI